MASGTPGDHLVVNFAGAVAMVAGLSGVASVPTRPKTGAAGNWLVGVDSPAPVALMTSQKASPIQLDDLA